MPPHCDAADGPVARAARCALDAGDVMVVLPYVPEDAEWEVRDAFDLAVGARVHGADARVVADRWFFETVVRIHRAGEGAPFTGLKPAGLDVGPAIPAAERALETGSLDDLTEPLCEIVREEARRRHRRATTLAEAAGDGVATRREQVEAALGLQVWAHRVYLQATSDAHEHGRRFSGTVRPDVGGVGETAPPPGARARDDDVRPGRPRTGGDRRNVVQHGRRPPPARARRAAAPLPDADGRLSP